MQSDNAFVNTLNRTIVQLGQTVSVIVIGVYMTTMKISGYRIAYRMSA